MIPIDRFTPHGYLDNPFHTRNLNPSGVIRSSLGLGFGWHYPALSRGYGYRQVYHAELSLAVFGDNLAQLDRPDFGDLHADIHTKNVFRYRWRAPGLAFSATFHRVFEHALACRVRIESAADRSLRLVALSSYTRQMGAKGVWGESGLVGLIQDGKVVLQGFEDGEAFVLGGDRLPAAAGATASQTGAWLREPCLEDNHAVVIGQSGETVVLHGAAAYDVSVTPSAPVAIDLILARGIRRDLALAEAAKALCERDLALSELLDDDRRFWAGAPRLGGDWPAHWRRGVIYDLETLRMMVRRPVGHFKHLWDAMQIQAPRVVLAEAAIDALLLAYADPATARALLLGTFQDAYAPNVPCSREDGSLNMVGTNGSECGTAPEWGYPIDVVRRLYALDEQPAWLAAIYPRLASYLNWWLDNRRDEAGYLVYDNSWESGQDLSARFGPQRHGGGSTIRSVRPVDLQAAMARACDAMQGFASTLGYADEASRWEQLASNFRAKVESLWFDGAYRDFDTRVGWSDVWDVMQLAPVALGLAAPARVAALRERIRSLDREPYLWPMFVWSAVDAALAAGEPEVAARIAFDSIERIYTMWDAPDRGIEGRVPGVTCEYWGVDGRCGAEGYGWGAFGLHLLLHVLLGFAPESRDSFSLTLRLPAAWLQAGRSYRVLNLPYQGAVLDFGVSLGDQGPQLTLVAHGARLLVAGTPQEVALIPVTPYHRHTVHLIR
jgi:hypothetical protein